MTMKPRLDPLAAAAADLKPMLALSESVHKSGLEPSLIELVKIRASQINGCAYCIHMHTNEARKMGESEEAIYLLDAWRESPLYSEIGRESCREHVCTYVSDSVVAVSLKKNNKVTNC